MSPCQMRKHEWLKYGLQLAYLAEKECHSEAPGLCGTNEMINVDRQLKVILAKNFKANI